MRMIKGHTGQALKVLNAICNDAVLFLSFNHLDKGESSSDLGANFNMAQFGQRGVREITLRLAVGQLQRLKKPFDHGYICFLFSQH